MVDVRFDIWMCEVAHLPPRRILEAREHFGTAEQACRLANTPEDVYKRQVYFPFQLSGKMSVSPIASSSMVS